ncbi:THAP domain-containing protein 7 [Merluccius polli]|uniref:THAP domain-containing protein 7 n=1 Tax=Merluccius polli TaxID=89951 RepID=A0AA47NRB8_MERPO|nr:THAP domain-containing protein 7 [Merluccius polli]
MPRHCSAGGCKSRDNRETRKAGITFHKLPKGASRRNLWITNSHRKGLWDPQTDFVYFCSKHFTPESFELTGYSGIRRLREDAFPTIFDASLEPKRKGPGRPRKRDAIHLRQKPQSQVAVQDTIQEDVKEAEKANCEEVQNLTPVKEEKHRLAAEADVNTLACSNEDASEPENVSRHERCPSPPVPQQSLPRLERPTSPSRYMRRLPPPPGFYLPKEHSYAQLCPLLWRRRYERAVDCLEKALRQLSAARRRENRLRTTLSRLREKHMRHAPQDNGQKTKRGWLASRRRRVAAVRTGGEVSFLVQKGESEFDMETEEAGLSENASGDPTDWARCFGPNTFSEDESGEYCFNCNRAGEGRFGRDTRPVSRAVNKNVRSVVHNGILRSQEEVGKWLPLLKPPESHKNMFINSEEKVLRESHEHHQFSFPNLVENTDDVQLVVLEGPHGDGFRTSLHLQSALKLPTSQSLVQTQAQVGLQQVILDGDSLHNFQVHSLQPALSDFGALVGQTKGAPFYKEPCQQVFFVQESTEGQLLLVPATTQDRLKGVDRTDDGAENVQTILEPQITFHPDLGPITEDEQNQGLEPSNGNIISTVVREDVREKLKEHLEGFQLQLSTEYIT